MKVALRRPAGVGGALSAVVMVVAALTLLPVVLVASEAFSPSPSRWRHLWDTRLPEMLSSTLLLLLMVSVGTLFVGVSLAWLVSAYRFPGRSIFRVALILPLAMPGYVLGYVFMTTFSFAGPVQSSLRDWFGDDLWFPEVRSLPGAAFVLTLTLYPYVYVLAMTALREQGLRTWQVARTLGYGRLRAAFRAVLPAARPTLAAGAALVMMEVLTDFATVQYFNVETIPVGIFRVWKGQGDRATATELAVLVLVFALSVIAVERALRGRARFYQSGQRAGIEPVRLQGWKRWGATGFCLSVLSFAFLFPIWRLATWISFDDEMTAGAYFEYLSNSFKLAGMAAVICLVVAGLVTSGARLSGGRATRWSARAMLVGYTLPGTVLAIGVLVAFHLGGEILPFDVNGRSIAVLGTTSIIGVLYAYLIRFVPLTTLTLDASLDKVKPSVVMAARTLGARPGRVLARIYAPMLRSGAAAALLLVFVHTMQELTIVLLLRPFGYETLSVSIWGLTQNSLWEQTGLPALTIVGVALLPVIIMLRAGGGSGDEPELERVLGEPAAVT